MSSEIEELFSVVQSDLDFQLRRELFSVVQSHPKKKGHRLTVSSGLCKRTPTSLRMILQQIPHRTPTSLRTISITFDKGHPPHYELSKISNHLTSVVTINRPTCDQLVQPPEKLGTCTSPPLMICLKSKNKKLHQTHYVDQNFQYPPSPKRKTKNT